MRLSKKSELNLTPLLDVILILLFVFMIMLAQQKSDMASQAEEYENEAKEYQDENEAADKQISDLEKENENLKAEIAQLQQDYTELTADTESANEQLSHLQSQIEEREETMNNAADALAEFIGVSSEDIEDLLGRDESISEDTIAKMTDKETVAESLLKFNALSKEFYFVDVELKGKLNKVYINDEFTSVGISLDELNSKDSKEEKIDEIAGLIEEALEDRQGGSAMTFITLEVHDSQVYEYAWKITWEAIGEVQEKYGTENIFRTHITLID